MLVQFDGSGDVDASTRGGQGKTSGPGEQVYSDQRSGRFDGWQDA